MSPEDESTPAGDPIQRYGESPRDFEPAIGDEASIEAIEQHLERHIGRIETVFHEIVSDRVHIDVHSIPPSDRVPFRVLATTGMSDLPMHAPEGAEGCRHAELLVVLPPDWPVDDEALNDENNYWPLRQLKFIARLPHLYDSWVWWGHTIPNGDPAEPYAESTRFSCVMLAPPVLLGDDFPELIVSEGKTIHFFALLPLYDDETQLKLDEGADEIFERFDEFGFTELIDTSRRSVASRRGGLLGWLRRKGRRSS